MRKCTVKSEHDALTKSVQFLMDRPMSTVETPVIPDLAQPVPGTEEIRGYQLLSVAITVATNMHDGQKDKAGEPYILHPIRVMLAGETTIEQVVGVLHDVVEDRGDRAVFEMTYSGLPEWVRGAVAVLTRVNSEPYPDYIARCSQHPLAARVKIHDLRDNLNPDRLRQVPEPDRSRLIRKYTNALSTLLLALDIGSAKPETATTTETGSLIPSKKENP